MVHKSILTLVFAICLGDPVHAGLIAYWSANGTANDSTGNHDGMLVNGAGYAAGANGQEAFQFNGVDQYMSAPASTDFAFGTSSFSIDLLANFSAIRTGPVGLLPNVLIANDEGPGNVNKWVFFYDGNGHLVFHINSPGSGPIFLSSPDSFNPTVGAWYHFEVTDIDGTYTFYENGLSLGTVYNATSIPFANAPLTIGESENLGYFNGLIQDVQISSIPEPSSIILASLAGFMIFSRRSRLLHSFLV